MMTRQQRNTELVNATARENVWAGIGAGALAFCGQLVYRANAGLPLITDMMFVWSLVAALGLFGLLSVVRFSLDEWRDSIERAQIYGVLEEQEATIEEQAATIAEQDAELARLRARVRGQEFKEAAKGARAIVTPEETGTAQRLRNAERILERWKHQHPYSREAVQMSRGDWEAAMSLLQSAGVVGRGGPGGRQWVIIANSYAEALHAVREKARTWERVEHTNFVAA